MLNPVREGEEDYIEAIRYRRRLKIFENFLFCFYLLRLYIKFAALHHGRHSPACFHWGLFRLSEVTIFVTDPCLLNPVREGEEDF